MRFLPLRHILVLLLLLLARSPAVAAFEFSAAEDCRDVCDGYFAFQSENEARACCQLTRNYSIGGPSQPQLDGKDVNSDSSNSSSSSAAAGAGITVSCQDLGGPDHTSVRVRYPASSSSSSSSSPVTQCPLCVGATAQGSQCRGGRQIPTEAPQNEEDSVSNIEVTTTASASTTTTSFSVLPLIVMIGLLFCAIA